MQFGRWRLRLAPRIWPVVIDGLEAIDGDALPPADYVNAVLLGDEHRDAFFALVDRVGLVVCKAVGGDDSLYRHVRGRSSRGRLSQGEFFHHDGCAGPIKPRIVEIRCPNQEVPRHTLTTVAPFPEVVEAMLLELAATLRTGELAMWHAAILDDLPLTDSWDDVQGTINRAVRRALSAEDQRAYLRRVDARVGAYREPWEMGETRFIANSNDGRTMQHRRGYLEIQPNGSLVKRWPAGPALVEDEPGESACRLARTA